MELFSFVFGAIFGSFLNVLIIRLPQEKSIVFPRSSCTKCNHIIYWYHNIPLISYLFLRGKCAYCNEKISSQYFFVELLSAFITMFLFIKLQISVEFYFMCFLAYVLIVLSFIDLKYKAVPDYLLLIALIISFLATPFNLIDSFKYAFLFSGAMVLLNFVITFYIQNIKSKILKDDSLKQQEALGEGDIPIIAIFGIILGINSGLVAIFLAALFAILPSIYSHFTKKDIETPFIPYLVLGFFVEYFLHLERFLKVVF